MAGHITAQGTQELRSRDATRMPTAFSMGANSDRDALKVQAFLSYSGKDRKLAGELKEGLEACGLSVFLAHEDIEPSVEWQTRILAELSTVDVFLPLLTSNFRESLWTDQESGVAVGRRCIIV